MRRREFIAGIGGAVAWPVVARAQQPERMRRIGVLASLAENDPEAQARKAALLRGLRELGWTESSNLRIEFDWSTGPSDDLRRRAADLIAAKPDVLLGTDTPTTQALQRHTSTVPIVFAGLADPVETEIVTSLARPGSNITGFLSIEPSLAAKWVALLKEIAPRVNRVLVMMNPGNAGNQRLLREIEISAPSIGVQVTSSTPRDAVEIEHAVGAAARDSNVGLIVMTGTPLSEQRKTIFALADGHHMPACYMFRFFAVDGGLMSYGPDLRDIWRRSAVYVDRILNGASPSDLPVQAPIKYELVLNLKTAKALGLTFPETLLATADEVIQ